MIYTTIYAISSFCSFMNTEVIIIMGSFFEGEYLEVTRHHPSFVVAKVTIFVAKNINTAFYIPLRLAFL